MWKYKSCGTIYPTGMSKKVHNNVDIIAKIGLVSSALSLLGSSSIIIFTIWKKLLKSEKIQPLFHLSLADFILSFLWIVSTVKYFAGTEFDHPARTAVTCFVWQLLAEIVHLATFFLTINYAIHVYMKLRHRTIQVHMITEGDLLDSNAWLWYRRLLYITSWLLPILLMMPILVNISTDNISVCQKCVILIDVPVLLCGEVPPVYGYIVLAMALTFSTTAIIIIYILSLRLYWYAVPGFHTDHQRRQLANMQARVTLYMLVFIVCWSPAFMISYHKWINHPHPNQYNGVVDLDKYFVLYVFQAICAPLQGLLNSIVYGWSRKHFRRLPNISSPRENEISKAPYHDFTSSMSLSDEDEYAPHDRNINGHAGLPLGH